MTLQESVARIEQAVDKLIVRCDEIAGSAKGSGKKVCNFFAPREARQTADLCFAFIAVIAGASSMASVVASAPALEALADHARCASTSSEELPLAHHLHRIRRAVLPQSPPPRRFDGARPREDRPSHGASSPPDLSPLFPKASRPTHGGVLMKGWLRQLRHLRPLRQFSRPRCPSCLSRLGSPSAEVSHG